MDRLKKFAKDHERVILITTNLAAIGVAIGLGYRLAQAWNGNDAMRIDVSGTLEDGSKLARIQYRDGHEQVVSLSKIVKEAA